MKKFARFLILALMLSTLLCVSAFAGDAGTFENVAAGASFEMAATGDKFDVTYTGVTSGKQYLILMVAKDSGGNYTINDSSIQYVDQAAATDSGVTFTVYPKEMVDAQILLAGGEEPVVLANYVTAEIGSDVTVETAGTIACTVSGNTVTVTHDAACKVGYLVDGEYVKITGTKNADGSYSFIVPNGVTNVLVAVKGDANESGGITVADKLLIARSMLSTSHAAYQTLTIEQQFACDLNDSNSLTVADKLLIARSMLSTGHAAYQAITW